MAFPELTLNTLPPAAELQELSDWETSDVTANFCISVWQYAKVLLELDKEGKIPHRAKKVLKELYFESAPLDSNDLTKRLGEKDKIVVIGNPGLGGFAWTFIKRLRSEFPEHPFPEVYGSSGNVCIQVFLDFFHVKKGGTIHFCLRSRFRMALALCFGDDTMKNW